MGETQATKEAVWLRSLLTELHANRSQTQATIIFEDNQGAIALAKNPQFHARTKYIDIQHHFVREKQDEGLIDICYISSAEQVADGLIRGSQVTRAFHYIMLATGSDIKRGSVRNYFLFTHLHLCFQYKSCISQSCLCIHFFEHTSCFHSNYSVSL